MPLIKPNSPKYFFMERIKTFFVTGATGNQGGAVVRNLLYHGFAVKALTRNPDSIKAKKLKDAKAEIIKGDLNDPSGFAEHLENVDGVFSVQSFENGIKKEIQQGIALADLAKQYAVPHFVYSSVIGSDAHTGIPHWESKSIIENQVKRLGLRYTIIRPASLYENFLIPQVKSRILKGKLVTPTDANKVQQFISSEDIGKITTEIFTNPEHYAGKTMVVAAEEMNMQEVANIFSEALGKKITYNKLSALITRLAMGKDLYKMFTWVNKNDAVFLKDINTFKKEFPNLLNLKTWIRQRFTN
jgi:uncharacterized protein YbjT (DUF2867 family)